MTRRPILAVFFGLAAVVPAGGVAAGTGGATESGVLQQAPAQKLLVAQATGKTDRPDDDGARQERAGELLELGAEQMRQGALQEAEANLLAALALFRELRARRPDNWNLQLDTSLTLEKIGDLRLRLGDVTGSLAAHRESLAIARWLAESNPTDLDLHWEVAVLLNKIGDTERRANSNIAAALENYQASIEIGRRLADEVLPSIRWRRTLAISYSKSGYAHVHAGDFAEALAAFNESAAISRRMAAQQPENPWWQRSIAMTLYHIGDAHLYRDDPDAALVAYEDSLAISRQLSESQPDDAAAPKEIAVALDRIATIHLSSDDTAAALAALAEGQQLYRRLVDLDPSDMSLQSGLAVSLQKIGDLALQGGDRPDALENYRQSLEISRRIVEAEPLQARWQADLAVGLVKLAAAGDAPEANLTEALTIAQAVEPARLPAHRRDLVTDISVRLAETKGDLAYAALFERDFALAEQKSRQALALAPSLLWLETNLAHALMFQDRVDEADALYLSNRGKKSLDMSWEGAILSDFAALQARAIDHPHMAEIEQLFKK